MPVTSTVRASGYVLPLSTERAETLLGHWSPQASIGEPVEQFAQSRRAPLIVFASFTPGEITHVARGRKGVASGTRLVRLNLEDMQELIAPVSMRRLLSAIPAKFRAAVARRFQGGGLLSPAAFQQVLAAMMTLAPDVADRLARFSDERTRRLAQLSPEVRRNLAQQKESVGLALKLAGFDPRELLAWRPPSDGVPASFLDGLPGARVREDAMIAHDLDHVPGFDSLKRYPFAARVFEREGSRLTVILANKLPLEQQFGADLLYYNEAYRAFVMVQYKAMEKRAAGKAEFRLPDAQLDVEIARMTATINSLAEIPRDSSRDSFRLHEGPFFLKLCSRHVFNPDDGGLFPGMYLPLDYWRRLVEDEATLGERGGRLVTFENVGRRLSETDFISLVAGGWVGSDAAQSNVLEQIVRDVIESGKAVALAVHDRLDRTRNLGGGGPRSRR
jgi:hypothetical protein